MRSVTAAMIWVYRKLGLAYFLEMERYKYVKPADALLLGCLTTILQIVVPLLVIGWLFGMISLSHFVAWSLVIFFFPLFVTGIALEILIWVHKKKVL